MMRKFLKAFAFMTVLAMVIISCKDGDSPRLVSEFDVPLNTANSIPVVTGRSETGTASFQLYDNNLLAFQIKINNLLSSDKLTIAHIHTGDVASTGDVLVDLVDNSKITFSGGMASGQIQLTDAQMSRLTQGQNLYVNVHSTTYPQGLVRGQINQMVSDAYNIALSPSNEIPPVTGRSETGMAFIRIVDGVMYYRLVVNNLSSTDAITMGHIHEGSSTQNGPVYINFNISNLGTTKTLSLTPEQLTKVRTAAVYVNLHSTQIPSGLMRGQIR
ncbi:CHRD domain-containing protein [Chryseobacterium fistulae]|uniref:CHRD domain-containing protein n=1 Tax=Chryseobacterium fistulae TaxID=2675058 RepID=A0A6N4XXW0_9FLAO|nr:CHRD domain-containing protein [Chryseobacterium fistulae]CAA7391430.1 hypothetical protein CHRY9393_02918 [Chryseobacterium fistulae]